MKLYKIKDIAKIEIEVLIIVKNGIYYLTLN